MPVTVPASGSVILAADIVSMHATVRTQINSIEQRHVGRGSFGRFHLGQGIVLGGDRTTAGPETVNTYPAGVLETPANIIAQWQNLANWRLDNGGVGYAMEPCLLLLFAVLHVERWITAVPTASHHACFNLYHSAGGVDQTAWQDSRAVWAQPSGIGAPPSSDWREVYDTVTIVKMVDYSGAPNPWTLNLVGVRSALVRGGGGWSPHLELYGGCTGFIAFHPQS